MNPDLHHPKPKLATTPAPKALLAPPPLAAISLSQAPPAPLAVLAPPIAPPLPALFPAIASPKAFLLFNAALASSVAQVPKQKPQPKHSKQVFKVSGKKKPK